MLALALMIFIILLVLGLSFGSFINALVWRLHEQSKPKNKRAAKDNELSIVSGRSMCPNCLHTLDWYDLLPVISWLSLGGRCRYCKKAISWQYPLVELATALLFVISYTNFPIFHISYSQILFAFWLVFIIGFVALAVYDLRWMILPDRIVFPLQILALVYVGIKAILLNNDLQVIMGALWGVLCLAGLFYLLFQVSKGRWIGGGDVKLSVVLGLLVGGPINALLVIFIASLMGSIFSVPLLLKGKVKIRIPFGPFLITATIIVYLFGASLVLWYKHQLLLV